MKGEIKLSSKRRVQQLRKTIQKKVRQAPQPKNSQEEEKPTQGPKITPKRVVVVLADASLHIHKKKSSSVLLNSEDHSKFIHHKLDRDPEDFRFCFVKIIFRPDLVHQGLLSLTDSTLNKSGMLQVYVHTTHNELIEINPETKIPRTYKRFEGMIIQLLNKRVIKAGEDNKILLRVVTGSLRQNIPEDSTIVGTSHIGKIVELPKYIEQNQDKKVKTFEIKKLVFVVGATSKGHPGKHYPDIDDCIGISRYQLSTSNCLSKITDCLETLYGII